jgi:hypothetical protein
MSVSFWNAHTDMSKWSCRDQKAGGVHVGACGVAVTWTALITCVHAHEHMNMHMHVGACGVAVTRTALITCVHAHEHMKMHMHVQQHTHSASAC